MPKLINSRPNRPPDRAPFKDKRRKSLILWGSPRKRELSLHFHFSFISGASSDDGEAAPASKDRLSLFHGFVFCFLIILFLVGTAVRFATVFFVKRASDMFNDDLLSAYVPGGFISSSDSSAYIRELERLLSLWYATLPPKAFSCFSSFYTNTFKLSAVRTLMSASFFLYTIKRFCCKNAALSRTSKEKYR